MQLLENLNLPVDLIKVKVYQKIVEEDSVALNVLQNPIDMNMSAPESLKKLAQLYKHLD